MNNAEFMENTPAWKLIAKLSIPTVIITLVMAVYNMADIFFIGKTGNTDMINAISVCMPVFTIVQAFGTLVGTGGCTTISLALGRNETERTKSKVWCKTDDSVVTGRYSGDSSACHYF